MAPKSSSGKPPRNRRRPSAKAAGDDLPSAQSPGSGFKVQIIYLAARGGNGPKAPVKDALWFATYPIIPRTGDCVFRDGVYYKVERVFLYENIAAGWCADVEVSFYARR